jgi:beta-1,4-mannosyltransferase
MGLIETDGFSGVVRTPQLSLCVGSWPGPRFQDNPLIAALCASLGEAGAEVVDIHDPTAATAARLDVLQIHWPEQIFWQGLGPCATVRKAWSTVWALARLKARGTRIVWMVHNLAPHDPSRWQRLLWRPYRAAIARLTDAFLTLSPSTVEVVRDAMPALNRKPGFFVWHPSYAGAVRSETERANARAALDFAPSTRVLACLGHVRPYKGVEELLEVFCNTAGDMGLVVAGAADDQAFVRKIAVIAEGDPRIRLILRSLPGAEFGALMAAADEIIAPFTDYLHSGSIVHALSARKPVCTPDKPFARDLASGFGNGWIRLYQPPLTATVLLSAMIPPTAQIALPDARDAGRRMICFYRALL